MGVHRQAVTAAVGLRHGQRDAVPRPRIENPAEGALQVRNDLKNGPVRRDGLEHVRDEAQLRTNVVEYPLRAVRHILWRRNI